MLVWTVQRLQQQLGVVLQAADTEVVLAADLFEPSRTFFEVRLLLDADQTTDRPAVKRREVIVALPLQVEQWTTTDLEPLVIDGKGTTIAGGFVVVTPKSHLSRGRQDRLQALLSERGQVVSRATGGMALAVPLLREGEIAAAIAADKTLAPYVLSAEIRWRPLPAAYRKQVLRFRVDGASLATGGGL